MSKLFLSSKNKAIPKTWVEISKTALIHNLFLYKSLSPKTFLCAVIKSNAYGHGIELVGKICQESNLADWIGVSSLTDALLLRSIGITKPILVMSIIDDSLKEALLNNISLIAYDLNFIKELNILGKKYNKKLNVHLKVDTGFSRLGILPNNACEFVLQIKQYPYIFLEGIFSHFAHSSVDDLSFTYRQYQQFISLIAMLKKNNITIPLIHIANTATFGIAELNNKVTMKRLGIGLYGLWPSCEYKRKIIQLMPNFSLKPALTWKTKIIQTKIIPANSYIGYGLTYKTNEQKKIALLPIGYWNGYDRKFSNNGMVKIGPFYASIVGKICMNLTIIDVTHIPDNFLYQDVILLSPDKNIDADNLAEKIGTINYEVVTRINPLISRVLVE